MYTKLNKKCIGHVNVSVENVWKPDWVFAMNDILNQVEDLLIHQVCGLWMWNQCSVICHVHWLDQLTP